MHADPTAQRTLTSQLAEDLAWLDAHCRSQPEQARHAGRLRLAGALVRNLLGPFLDAQPVKPLHVAVVGGAGAGKSTVANLLSGVLAAETNPQAGYTRHPVAYSSSNGQPTWPAHLGFLGTLERLTRANPANLDADVYQVRHVAPEPGITSVLDQFVVWDCPDMTTWAASGYVGRLMEIAGLADVIIYVASDERYNDQVPTEFLKLLVEAGKAVVVCLVKMREADAAAFVEHFRKDVLSRLPGAVAAVVPVPQLTPAQLIDPVHQASHFRMPLVNQVEELGRPPATARQRSVRRAIDFLRHGQDKLLAVARDDLAALDAWRRLVQEGQVEFEARYRREYLTSERFHRFDQALVRLLDLLELPGVGRFLGTVLWVLRTPYRLLRGLFNKALRRPEGGGMPEQPVLDAAVGGWLDLLRKETARRAEAHPVWAHLRQGFGTGLADQARKQFGEGCRAFQLSLAGEIERTARAIYEDLEKNPVALNTLRGTKFALEIGSITGTIATVGLNWIDLILVPLAASVTHQLVELFGKAYVDNQREQARARQMALVNQHVSAPLAEWLTHWPATGGSTYERLHLALRRIPHAISEMNEALSAKLL
jgi:energy-coupling factor transporter ATP-binding protein EcfA2